MADKKKPLSYDNVIKLRSLSLISDRKWLRTLYPKKKDSDILSIFCHTCTVWTSIVEELFLIITENIFTPLPQAH